jgi:hypothetical protein
MNNQKTLRASIRSGLLIVATSIVISCSSGGGDDSSGSATDTSTAVRSASANIITVLETNAAAINSVTADSPAFNSLASSAGLDLADTDSVGVTDDLGKLLGAMLDENTADITRDGNRINVKPRVADFCDLYATTTGIATDSDMYTSCLDIMVDVRLAIDVTGNDTGTLSISHKGNTPIHVQYSSTQLIYTVDLSGAVAALGSVVEVMSPGEPLDLPATVSGTVVIDIKALGKEHASTQLKITDAIRLYDSKEGIDVTISPATLFSAEVNGVAGTATMSASLNTVSGNYPVDVGTSSAPNTVKGRLDLTGAAVTLNITDAGKGMTGDVAFGPMKIKLNNAAAVDFVLDPQFTVDPASGVITLKTALSLDMAVVDDYDYFDMYGDLTVTAPKGTSFAEVAGSDGVYQVKTGSITISATGTIFSGPSAVITTGQCFDIENGRVTCPF